MGTLLQTRLGQKYSNKLEMWFDTFSSVALIVPDIEISLGWSLYSDKHIQYSWGTRPQSEKENIGGVMW